jgi:hypothetical protein
VRLESIPRGTVSNDSIETKPRRAAIRLRLGVQCVIAQGRTVLTLLRRARRRLLYHELLGEGANAASAALVAFILLLLAGTQVLDWHWVLSIPIAAAAFGIYRARKRVPKPYRVAQILDRRLGFADALSTAFHFHSSDHQREIERIQGDQAERLAESADVRRAIPFVMPRAVYPLAALALVASSLFALRYGITRRLDLKPPLAHLLHQTGVFGQRTEEARKQKPQDPEAPLREDPSAAESSQPEQKGGNEATDANEPDPSDDPQSSQAEKKGGKGENQKDAENGEPGQQEQNSDADEQSGKESRPGEGQQDAKSQQKQDSGGKQQSGNSGDDSSLMSKVKDAMQNLLSRMKPQQSPQGSQQQSSMDRNNQSKNQNNGKQQADKQGRQNSGEQGESQEGQSGEQAENTQDAQGQGQGKNDSQQASKQPGSGIGSHDGDKNVKQAADLAAMGKISELFGKRSANITGETTVEVQSTAQQLHTPYAQRGAQHSQSGAEIHRDEIPVALQIYVEHYFEQIRKQAPPVKK